MSDIETLRHQESLFVAAAPAKVYDLVSDITRTGEWSPICTGCWWDDPDDSGQVGAWFTGRNQVSDRTWETRSQVVVADRPDEFAFVVGGSYVRWGYVFVPHADGTMVTESWEFLPEGLNMFRETYGDAAEDRITLRTNQARAGIPVTLAALKRIAESNPAGARS